MFYRTAPDFKSPRAVVDWSSSGSGAPGREAARGAVERARHCREVMRCPLSLHGLEHRYRVRPVSVSKKAARELSRSALVRPSVRRSASRSACFTYLRSDSVEQRKPNALTS